MDIGQNLSLISSLAVLGGLVFAGWQVHLLQKQNARDATLQLLESFQSQEFVEGLRLVCELPDGLSKAEIEARVGERVDRIWLFMLTLENIGLLVSRRDLPLSLIQDFFTGPVLIGWRKLGPQIADLRKQIGSDTALEYFQWLAEQLGRRTAHHPIAPAHVRLKDWTP